VVVVAFVVLILLGLFVEVSGIKFKPFDDWSYFPRMITISGSVTSNNGGDLGSYLVIAVPGKNKVRVNYEYNHGYKNCNIQGYKDIKPGTQVQVYGRTVGHSHAKEIPEDYDDILDVCWAKGAQVTVLK
jgi:hypothetical protein